MDLGRAGGHPSDVKPSLLDQQVLARAARSDAEGESDSNSRTPAVGVHPRAIEFEQADFHESAQKDVLIRIRAGKGSAIAPAGGCGSRCEAARPCRPTRMVPLPTFLRTLKARYPTFSTAPSSRPSQSPLSTTSLVACNRLPSLGLMRIGSARPARFHLYTLDDTPSLHPRDLGDISVRSIVPHSSVTQQPACAPTSFICVACARLVHDPDRKPLDLQCPLMPSPHSSK
ncbi:hypothetical protein FKP32DRAFT_178600 [Trametes sanguinea]|nr:hypothetical protein FKP32DRAFT_178600 [Trametes sanguinea]